MFHNWKVRSLGADNLLVLEQDYDEKVSKASRNCTISVLQGARLRKGVYKARAVARGEFITGGKMGIFNAQERYNIFDSGQAKQPKIPARIELWPAFLEGPVSDNCNIDITTWHG